MKDKNLWIIESQLIQWTEFPEEACFSRVYAEDGHSTFEKGKDDYLNANAMSVNHYGCVIKRTAGIKVSNSLDI